MTANQGFFLALHAGAALLIVAAHAGRSRLSLGPVLVVSGLLTFLIWHIAQAAWWVRIVDLRVNAAHLGLMPAVIAGGLLVYSMDGVKAGRTYIAVVAGTAALATVYLEFMSNLSEVVPLPDFVYLSLYGQFSLGIGLVAGVVGSMVYCEALRRFLHWIFAMFCSLVGGSLTVLLVVSVTSYGFPLAFVNITNEIHEYGLAGVAPGLILCAYGWVAQRANWVLPARPIRRLFQVWQSTEEEIREARQTALEAKHTISELRDLNRRLEQERILREHQVENSPLAVVEVDGGGVIKRQNLAAQTLFGDTANRNLARSMNDVLPGFDRFLADPDRVSELLQLGGGSGYPRSIDVTVMPLRESGGLAGFSVLLEDVTERERSRLQRQILGRMRGVHMAGRVVAHDFANLVTAIEGKIASIRADLGDQAPDTVERSLGAIRQAVARARHMLDQLGGTQPFNEPDLRPCRIAALLDEAVEIERPSAEGKQIDLRVDQLPSVSVDVDSTQIVRVLLNILRNAIEATPEGEFIRIAAHAEEASVTVAVSDTGRGMTREQVAQAFQPGFSTKGRGEGGIGLAVSYLIADAHGGGLDIDSHPGEGTTVRLTLNRVGQAGQVGQGGTSGCAMERLTGRRVLMAMVASGHRDAVVDALLSDGCGEVAEVETTEEVRAILDEDTAWDAVITDGTIEETMPADLPVFDLRRCPDKWDAQAVLEALDARLHGHKG